MGGGMQPSAVGCAVMMMIVAGTSTTQPRQPLRHADFVLPPHPNQHSPAPPRPAPAAGVGSRFIQPSLYVAVPTTYWRANLTAPPAFHHSELGTTDGQLSVVTQLLSSGIALVSYFSLTSSWSSSAHLPPPPLSPSARWRARHTGWQRYERPVPATAARCHRRGVHRWAFNATKWIPTEEVGHLCAT